MPEGDRKAVALRRPTDAGSRGPLSAAATWSRLLIAVTAVVAGAHLIGLPALSAPAVVILAGAGLLAGLPHGGVDHLMAMRLAGRSLVPVVVVYAGLAGVAWFVLRWGGPAALVAVIALSALHFGLGELEFTSELTGWRPSALPAVALVVAGSGAVLLPLARSGEEFNRVATAVSPGLARLIAAEPVRTATLLVWLTAAVIAVTVALMSKHVSAAVDVVLIGLLGMMAPPLVAFAVWFGGWHAVRHCARMLTLEPGCAALLREGRTRAAWRRLAGLAAPMSGAALLMVLALGVFTAVAPDPAVILAEVLRLLLALTVPHMAIVWWLDRQRERVG